MLKTGLLSGIMAALMLIGCGDKDPVSPSAGGESEGPPAGIDDSPITIAPGEPHPDRMTYEVWSGADLAADLNADGLIDRDDFAVFLDKNSGGREPGDDVLELVDGTGQSVPNPGGDSSLPELENPFVYVASNEVDAAQLARWLDDADLISRIKEANFNNTWVVGVFRGRMDSGGYDIAIEEVRSTDETVDITVRLTDPEPGDIVTDVISYPYDVILVPREDLPAASTTKSRRFN